MNKPLLLAIGLGLAIIGPSASAADINAGEKVFKKCKACHSLQPGKKKVGPSLYGVVGRKSGTLEGFKFSKAMKNADITWDEKTLDEYLTKPRAYVKGTRMAFVGLKKGEDRENVIAYIKEKSKQPEKK